jgi:neutral ceramidase
MKIKIVSFTTFVLILLVFFSMPTKAQTGDETGKNEKTRSWKTGVARAVITPRDNIWMSGFAARDKPADGKLHDLWVKVLALEDADGNIAILVTTDIIGYNRELAMAVTDRIQEKHQLERKNILLSASHTHCGPAVNKNLFGIYPPFDDQMKQQVMQNLAFLEDQIVQCVDAAVGDLSPSDISTGVGIARFAVNRRNNKESDVLYAADLAGPSDHSVPVIRILDKEGNLKAIVCGYACHATTLGNYQWSGDFPGFTQIDLEETYPGVTALFFAGCGADQNAFPRMTVPLAQQYGNELADAVKRVLQEPMKNLNPEFHAVYNEIGIAFAEPLSTDELKEIEVSAPAWQQRWATDMIGKIERGEEIPREYPYYPVQTWKLGDQTLVALGGEVVVDYAHRIREKWGNELFIAGYANDVMAYIPSERVLKEGGYEGDTSMRAYGQPSTWRPGIEEKILSEVGRQVTEMNKK